MAIGTTRKIRIIRVTSQIQRIEGLKEVLLIEIRLIPKSFNRGRWMRVKLSIRWDKNNSIELIKLIDLCHRNPLLLIIQIMMPLYIDKVQISLWLYIDMMIRVLGILTTPLKTNTNLKTIISSSSSSQIQEVTQNKTHNSSIIWVANSHLSLLIVTWTPTKT